ncbi:MAG TPA: hypothetical protein VGS27_18750 [Candidatus Sulfotelmatobacter sp.]|nr:hypothetical protein [Candidatus Sulfotelmatobacter sp.]
MKLAHLLLFPLVLIAVCRQPCSGQAASADNDALALYRSSWNPLTAGPQLITTADLLAPGKFFVKTYAYSEFGWAQYGEGWSTGTQPLPQHLSVVNPQLEFDYGVTNSIQVDAYTPAVSWWQGAGQGQPASHGTGVGDTTVDLRYRFRIQRPGTWRPTLALVSYLALPTSSWFNTPSTPGGFAPLGKLPSTHFGTPVLTEALAFRKNVRPFRVSGGVYYSYAIPSSNDGAPKRYGDIFQYRLAGEHVLNDKHGFGYAIELIGIHGLPFRIDRASVTAGQKTFGVVGGQATVEYNLTHRIVSSVGVLFTAAGNRDIAGVFPNFSIYYYFGKVRPR